MSDLPKRLQEQAAANQKGLAYKQANARTARAARQQGRKRPSDPVEERKKRKPVAVAQDEIGFRFYFTTSFVDVSRYFSSPPSSLPSPIAQLISSYQAVVDRFGDGWPTGVVQLSTLPPDLSDVGYRFGEFSIAVPTYGSRWLDRLSSLSPATFPEVRQEPFSSMEFNVVQPSVVTAFQQVNALTADNLAEGFDDGLEALESGSIVIAYEEAMSWDVPLWPAAGANPFPRTFTEPLTVPIYNTPANSYQGPAVDLHTFRTSVVKTCQAASDSGAIVLLHSINTSSYSYVVSNYLPRFYKGLSGVDQGGNDVLFELLALNVNALDLILDLGSPGTVSAIQQGNSRGRFLRFLDQQHPVALDIETSLSGDSRFCAIIPYSWQGLRSIFLLNQYEFAFANDQPLTSNPYAQLSAFLNSVNGARSLDPIQRSNSIYEVLGPDFLFTPLTEEYRRKAADIERVRIKTLQAAANAYFDLSTTLASGLPPLKSD